jgi:superfamily I DNA and/or RNA helicase
VKAAYASNERNNAYVSDLLEFFRRNVSPRNDDLERALRFNIKNSVLDLFELIRNYSVMLRKHFRGYQELISFSSDYFYGKRLQAVKFRGKPIEDVIKFTDLEHDGRHEKYKNTNSPGQRETNIRHYQLAH